MQSKEDKIKKLIQKYMHYEQSFIKEPPSFMSQYRDSKGKRMNFNEMYSKKQNKLNQIVKKIIQISNEN